MVNGYIKELVRYAEEKGLIQPCDAIWATNRLLEVMQLSDYADDREIPAQPRELEAILKDLIDDAAARGLLDGDSVVQRDLFDTKLMGVLVPPPSQVIAKFRADYAISPKTATDNYYRFSGDTDYIRRYRIVKDLKWVTPTVYGDLDITVNLSKPEKDPKAIAAAKKAPPSAYPKCALCRETEGYAGRLNAAARQSHRIIPITINGAPWCLQYSPYSYYNEHCIVFNAEHTPMKIDRSVFVKLFDFVSQFPHYFVGSNADLPIVGGSILSHEHFQGGNYEFAMAKAEIEREFTFLGFESVRSGILRWPMSVIRLSGEDPAKIVDLADKILLSWRNYTDEAAVIYAETDGEPHNTVTPIARMRDGRYELDLVLRNNLTTPEHPDGLYHPHAALHHIKKENIGLIEVMGIAVLPSRLKKEMAAVAEAILADKDLRADPLTASHADWVEEFLPRYASVTPENVDEILHREIGVVFGRVLEDAGVYKCTAEGREAFLRFLKTVK
ncbi:MAG: UDP-glucose--hexose-1-phosphate uridylyltransferase [Clostridia bacterium]|nr:UDP-glucose--hexose-1-phosphate uridylyltransferase [Clostridia bacterium]